MLISASTCPLCRGKIDGHETRCPHCRSLIQLTLDPPEFSRSAVLEPMVFPILQSTRRKIAANRGTGYDFYVLGLGYLNYEMPNEGLEMWSHAAALLPDQDRIHFELAMLHYVRGEYHAGLQEVDRALEMAPGRRDYELLRGRLRDAAGHASGDMSPAVLRWIAAYEANPNSAAAQQALQMFISAHEERLKPPLTLLLRSLDSADAERLRTLGDDPVARAPRAPGGPKPPPEPGPLRLELLARISPERAAVVRQMHEERVAAYTRAREEHEAALRAQEARHSGQVAAWQSEVEAIRADLPAMARLVLALLGEEARLRQLVERRKADWEARKQEEALQEAILRQTPAPTGSQAPRAPEQKPIERRYLFTRARYLQGLPGGKEGDAVALTVTDQAVTIYHADIRGRWKQVVPTERVVEAARETLWRPTGAEQALRITFLDEGENLQHVFLAGLEADVAEAARKAEQAMGRAPAGVVASTT